MNQKPLITLIRSELLRGLARYGVTDLPVRQGYQPTTQGRVTRCIYFWSLADTPEGWQYRTPAIDPVTTELKTRETQILVSSFQIGALIPDDPENDAQLTALDATRLCSQIVQSNPFTMALAAQNVGVRRVGLIRNPQFVNEQSQYEYEPSFDFTVTHKQSIIQLTDSIDTVEFNLHRV